jgi:hypothetical protein
MDLNGIDGQSKKARICESPVRLFGEHMFSAQANLETLQGSIFTEKSLELFRKFLDLMQSEIELSPVFRWVRTDKYDDA